MVVQTAPRLARGVVTFALTGRVKREDGPMGYEVLDSRGAGPADSGEGPPGAVDVVDLDIPNAIEPSLPQVPRLRRRAEAAVSAAANAVATAPRTTRRRAAAVATLVVVSVLVGALLAGVAVRRQQQDQRDQERRGFLAAGATVTNYTPSENGNSTVVQLTVALNNYGPLPVDVVTTPAGQTGGTTVATVADSPTATRGATVAVLLTVPVECKDLEIDHGVTMPVRTADRRVHAVPVQMPFGGEQTLRESTCAGSGRRIHAAIGGPVSRPTLHLENNADENLDITLDATSGLPPLEDGGRAVTVTTVPAMPVVLKPRGSRDLRLLVTARHCPADVGLLLSGSYLTVQAVSPDGQDLGSGVDIGALIGVALARVCAPTAP